MANLRDLIDYTNKAGIQTSQSLGAVVAPPASPNAGIAATAFAPSFPGSAYKQIKYRGNHCCGAYSCYWECFMWRPPMGTTFLKFEIWGGGGSGAGGCCCGWGTPGGSGAYAYKCICSATDLGGCVYEFCIAGSSCMPPDVYGVKGYKTFAVGYGLDNFCAEGGLGGNWNCQYSPPWTMTCFCDYPVICGDGARLNTNAYCTATNGVFLNVCDCLTPGQLYGTGMISPYDMYDNCRFSCGRLGTGYYDLVGAGNTFGSGGKRVRQNHTLNPCYGGVCYICTFCAPYFGADGGSRGIPGGLGSPCNHDASDYCMIQQYLPYPGGLINTRGGWVTQRTCGILQCSAVYNALPGEYFGYTSTTDSDGYGAIPGMGGRSTFAYCGYCYCGGPGSGGQLIITYG
jgi:hypothetical protein